METKKIIIKNVTGEYSFEIPNNKAEKTFEGILDCLKGKRNGYGYRKEGTTVMFPAELLKSSVITFENTELSDDFDIEKI